MYKLYSAHQPAMELSPALLDEGQATDSFNYDMVPICES
jgi:hypothetical protein